MAAARVLERRAAVALICDSAARSVVERVVTEATRATSAFGLTREKADAYAAGIFSTLPLYTSAIRMADSPERDATIEQLAHDVRGVSETHHIPRIVERA